MSDQVNFYWFRRDLRLKDNKGLLEALNSSLPIIPVFIFDKNILEKLETEDTRVQFIYETLVELKKQLQEKGSDLLIKHGDVQKSWQEIIEEYDVQEVYANEDYEPYALKRDKKIASLLRKNGSELYLFQDQCIFAKNQILKNDGKPYTVYTPYKNKWLQTLTPKDIQSFLSEKKLHNLKQGIKFKLISLDDIGFKNSHLKYPQKVLKKKIIENYHEQRDIPSIDATSHLGIHLRFGTLSVRRAVQVAYELNQTWLSQLIWREFFIQILYHFPHVQKEAFRPQYNNIKWRNNKKEFELWKAGKTGYPIVDAGMRELAQTGHMHNRVRMITASFLVKDLLIDWRWGEKYFASKLLDFELASNNGSWQWVAGTGCDAAPYFRIFNPYTQQKKFDPNFKYIKKWIPEFGTDDYPEEIVDHKEAYHRTQLTYQIALDKVKS